ncbi:hypothetical protein HHK36_008762 [Tetracentron sinense]|uniref:Protein kinase domain-containing protein n=1 Tax=Tetracentron sinense TaxID=13715 RepID=A0A834ZQP4_TETSI|nr:hypothetical protein HHK36_008762 [Tetracentron sinense]
MLACFDCYKQLGPIYDPKKSSTYFSLGCNSRECKDIPVKMRGCRSPNTYTYNYDYGDGSYSNDTLDYEYFEFKNPNGNSMIIHNATFDCGNKNKDTNACGATGILVPRNPRLAVYGVLWKALQSFLTAEIMNLGRTLARNLKVVKVADFGVSRVQAQSGVMTVETGTYRWMAPEVVDESRIKVIEHKPYDHKADVFSFGILLWVLLTRKVPYEYLTPLQAAVGVVQKGLRPTIPKHTHPKLVELIERCWQQDPTMRPEFSKIIEILRQIAKEV